MNSILPLSCCAPSGKSVTSLNTFTVYKTEREKIHSKVLSGRGKVLNKLGVHPSTVPSTYKVHKRFLNVLSDNILDSFVYISMLVLILLV